MIHANKMILVPHEIVGENESIAKYLSNLDREMLHIINDKTLPMDEKILKYNQILRRYQAVKQDTEKPFKLEVQESEVLKREKEPTASVISPQDNIVNAITDTVPQKWQKHAQMLLKYAHAVPGMKWSEKGELIIDGNKIAGSNIVDIINDLSRERKTEPVTGADVFLQKLMDQNVPKEAIVNKRRLTRVPSVTYAATQSPPKQEEVSTPTASRNRATSSIFANWANLGR